MGLSKLDQVIARNMMRTLPDHWRTLSDDSLGDLLAPVVHRGLEGAATYAHFVKTSVVDAVWEGAKAIG